MFLYFRKIAPAENIIVSFLALGEGWHNYHHTFPWDYKAAELPLFFNVTSFWLKIFQKIGWAYDLKTPSKDLVRRVTEKTGDGTHWEWGHHKEVPEEF